MKIRFLIFSGEAHTRVRQEYMRLGDRLIVTHQRQESGAAGMGEREEQLVTVTVRPRGFDARPVPPPPAVAPSPAQGPLTP